MQDLRKGPSVGRASVWPKAEEMNGPGMGRQLTRCQGCAGQEGWLLTFFQQLKVLNCSDKPMAKRSPVF